MLNLLIATRLWIKQWQSKNILLFSDNAAVVATLQAGKAHEPFLRAAAREIWLLTARHDVGLTVRHRPGASAIMHTADALSRAHLAPHFLQITQTLTKKGSQQITVPSCLIADPLHCL